jgi:hypothetical protein
MTLKYQLEAIKQMTAIVEELGKDVVKSRDEAAKDGGPFWRRTLVRALFAYIEGSSYRLKQVAPPVAEYNSVALSKAETALLTEESYDLNDKGEAIIKKAKLRTAENLLFSVKIVSKAAKSTYEIDKSTEGWSAFKETIKIRDRITHPKSTEELNISDNELKVIMKTMTWFAASINNLLETLIPPS